MIGVTLYMVAISYVPLLTSMTNPSQKVGLAVASADALTCEVNADCNSGMVCSGGGLCEIIAGGGANIPGGGGANIPGGGGANNIPAGGGANVVSTCGPNEICNPLLTKYNSLCKVLNGIILLITEIGAIIAVLLIIWTGFKFISAQGNEAKLTEAKKAFYTTLIGTAVLLGASGIAQVLVKTVLTVTNQGNPGICRI